MSSTSSLTIRVPANLKRRLDTLAKRNKRSKSLLAVDAVEQYVAELERQEAILEKADAEIAAGKSVPHADVRRWLLSWGGAEELPPPSCK